MKTAHFDCLNGISGDMSLGALIDAGLNLKDLQRGLSGLSVKGFELKTKKVHKGHLQATKVDVLTSPSPSSLKTLNDLLKTVKTSRLPDGVRKTSLKILKRLVEAEAKVHGLPASRLRPHGMDPVDTLVDIVGVVLGLDLLKVTRVTASPVPVGAGPYGLSAAAAQLLKEVPVLIFDTHYEITTPTGAALLSTLVQDFRPSLPFTYEALGYGAGTWEIQERPDVLRIFIGKSGVESSY